MAVDRQARKINNLTSALIVAVFVILGLSLLWLSNSVLTGGWATITEQAGGTVLVAALLTVAWEAYGRRALAGEVMEAAQLSGEVQRVGLTGIGTDFRDIPFGRLLKAENIDIYLGLGRTFYSHYSTDFQAAVTRPTTKIRVILADPTDEAAVECMAERFSRSTDEVKSNIRTATANFLSLGRGAAGDVKVYYRSGEPLTSLYLFDNEAVVTLYNHRRDYGDFPFMMSRSGGTLFDFLRKDFDSLIEQSTLQTGIQATPRPGGSTTVPTMQN